MKRKLEKPEVKIVKLQSMDVIATSESGVPVPKHAVGMYSTKAHDMRDNASTQWTLY